jgi:hypothetical protein
LPRILRNLLKQRAAERAPVEKEETHWVQTGKRLNLNKPCQAQNKDVCLELLTFGSIVKNRAARTKEH